MAIFRGDRIADVTAYAATLTFCRVEEGVSTFSTVCRLSSSICVLRLASLFLRVSAAGFSVSSGRRAELLVFLVDTLSLASLFIRGGGPRR